MAKFMNRWALIVVLGVLPQAGFSQDCSDGSCAESYQDCSQFPRKVRVQLVGQALEGLDPIKLSFRLASDGYSLCEGPFYFLESAKVQTSSSLNFFRPKLKVLGGRLLLNMEDRSVRMITFQNGQSQSEDLGFLEMHHSGYILQVNDMYINEDHSTLMVLKSSETAKK